MGLYPQAEAAAFDAASAPSQLYDRFVRNAGPSPEKIADRMIDAIVLASTPKRCLCCGAPAGKVRHD